jgi:hypothetical protein
LIEFDGPAWPIIVDRPLYRELVKGAIRRTHDDLDAKAATAAKEKTTAGAGKQPADPLTVAKRERDAQLRELTDQAHGANLDLGRALIHNPTNVDPTDIDVARFFVLCGCPHRTNYADGSAMPMRPLRMRGEASRLEPAVAVVARSGCEFGKGTRPAFGRPRVSSSRPR